MQILGIGQCWTGPPHGDSNQPMSPRVILYFVHDMAHISNALVERVSFTYPEFNQPTLRSFSCPVQYR